MTGKLKDLTMNIDGTQNITIVVNADFREEYDKLKNNDIEVTFKKISYGRSLDANSFLWHLCSEVAKRSSKYSTDGKNEIYREAVRAKGVWKEIYIRSDAVETFIRDWSDHGVGWFADVIDEFTNKQGITYKQIHVYSGTSTYTSAEMSNVIDYVIMIANDLGIPTMTPKEMNKILGKWEKKQLKRGIA